MKFCKDCAHYKLLHPSQPAELGMCSRKANIKNPVTGDFEAGVPHPFCRAERVSLTGNCGFEALFFTPKEKDVPNV